MKKIGEISIEEETEMNKTINDSLLSVDSVSPLMDILKKDHSVLPLRFNERVVG